MSPIPDTTFHFGPSAVLVLIAFFNLLGGDKAISAMYSAQVDESGKWLGWYNAPGGFAVAKKYGRLAKSRFWTGLLPGDRVDPTTLFNDDGQRGPEFIAAHSGTNIKDTGHLGQLLVKQCQSLTATKVPGRETTRTPVTIVMLETIPEEKMHLKLQKKWAHLFAAIPILASLAGCAACWIAKDWYSFSMISLGILSNGLSCLAIGLGKLEFTHPIPANGCISGDGFLHAGTEIVILLGHEGAVNAITRGRFSLHFIDDPNHRPIGLVAALLLAQFLLQLLVIPQGTSFGQTWFLSTLAVSWIYNCYLSSLDKEQIQREILVKQVLQLKDSTLRYSLGTWTAMAIFVLLALNPREFDRQVLDHLLPNSTAIWNVWKGNIIERSFRTKGGFSYKPNLYQSFSPEDQVLVQTLYDDAEAGSRAYKAFEEENLKEDKDHKEFEEEILPV